MTTWGEDVRILLTDFVLEKKNLEMVFTYLEESTGKQVLITDCKGKIYNRGGATEFGHPDDRYLTLPCLGNKGSSFHDKDTGMFYYQNGHSETDGFVIIKDVNPECCEIYLKSLNQASLAVRTYLSQMSAQENIVNLYADNFITDVLLRNINIKELMKNNRVLQNLDLNNLYYVCILEPGKTLNEREMRTLYSYTKEWLAFANLDIFCTIWDKQYVVFVCPTHYDRKTLEIDYGWARHLTNITKYFKECTAKFKFPALMGIGNKYALSNLHRSYQEAIFAIQLSKLTGKRNIVKHFSDLGIFTLVCRYELTELKEFSNKYLEAIVDFDREYNRELLNSLRGFFDANLDVKEAAERLHMHINTLRYRLKKIEELSGVNLQQIEDRSNLYVALKIYELLQSTELDAPPAKEQGAS